MSEGPLCQAQRGICHGIHSRLTNWEYAESSQITDIPANRLWFSSYKLSFRSVLVVHIVLCTHSTFRWKRQKEIRNLKKRSIDNSSLDKTFTPVFQSSISELKQLIFHCYFKVKTLFCYHENNFKNTSMLPRHYLKYSTENVHMEKSVTLKSRHTAMFDIHIGQCDCRNPYRIA